MVANLGVILVLSVIALLLVLGSIGFVKSEEGLEHIVRRKFKIRNKGSRFKIRTTGRRFIRRPRTIADVEPIALGRNDGVTYRDGLANVVEEPIRAAALELFDKNIVTYTSSANVIDVGRNAKIGIIYSKLSPENKVVAEQLVNEGHAEIIEEHGKKLGLYVPIRDKNVPVSEIKEKMLKLANRFKLQRVRLGTFDPKHPSEELIKLMEDVGEKVNLKDPKAMSESLRSATNFPFSEETEKFYFSNELLEKDEKAYAAHKS